MLIIIILYYNKYNTLIMILLIMTFSYCRYDCHLICWFLMSAACCCRILVAASISRILQILFNIQAVIRHQQKNKNLIL